MKGSTNKIISNLTLSNNHRIRQSLNNTKYIPIINNRIYKNNSSKKSDITPNTKKKEKYRHQRVKIINNYNTKIEINSKDESKQEIKEKGIKIILFLNKKKIKNICC